MNLSVLIFSTTIPTIILKILNRNAKTQKFSSSAANQDTEPGTSICNKCGSTEHSVKNCKIKVSPGDSYFQN
jgi:hypothetical protein